MNLKIGLLLIVVIFLSINGINFSYSEPDYKIGTIQWEKDVYHISEQGVIQVEDPDRNNDPKNLDSIEITVWSDTYPRSVHVSLLEIDFDSGIFEGTIDFVTPEGLGGNSTKDKVLLWIGDTVTAEYTDETLPIPYRPGQELDWTSTAIVVDDESQTSGVGATFTRIIDVIGNPSTKFTTGQDMRFTSLLKGMSDAQQQYYFIVEIKNNDGTTVYQNWITNMLSFQETNNPIVGWNSDSPGNFVAEITISKYKDKTFIFVPPERIPFEVTKKENKPELSSNLTPIDEQFTNKTTIAQFVDPSKGSQYYVDRYYDEPKYKEWFDRNYPAYTIEEAVGLPSASEQITKNTKLPEWIRNMFIWYGENKISEEELLDAIEFLIKQKVIKIDSS